MFQKFSRDRWKITIFLERKSRNRLFFNFSITKVSYFVSNLNEDFHEASFEVYYVSVSQKLGILGFSPQIFFILTSVTSDTSWGQSMSLSDFNEVSNFSWRCQLSYEVLFVEFGWKLKHPETSISHWALLDPSRILNWPKSPHRLGLRWETNCDSFPCIYMVIIKYCIHLCSFMIPAPLFYEVNDPLLQVCYKP